MIMSVRTHRPALGKQAELRAALTEWVRTRQSEGADTSLTRRIYNTEAPAFHTATRFPDLAAMDEGRKRVESSKAFGPFQERQIGLLAAPASVRVYNVLVAPQAAAGGSPSLPAGAIVATWSIAPATGRAGELQRLLKEHVEQLQSQGLRCSLRSRMLSDEGPELVITHLYEDLAAHQAFRASWLPTDEARAFFQAIRPLQAAHEIARLSEVLVPFPTK